MKGKAWPYAVVRLVTAAVEVRAVVREMARELPEPHRSKLYACSELITRALKARPKRAA